MPPVLASGTEKMPKKWFDYGTERLASEEQRAWIRDSQFGSPSRQSSLEAFSGLIDNNHGQNHGHGHGNDRAQNRGYSSNPHGQSSQQVQHTSSLDNAVEDLLNNHLLSRAQRSESLASSSSEFCPVTGRLLAKPFPNRLPSNQHNGPPPRNQMNVARTPSIAGRLSSIGSMDLNPINERMSSIGSLGDVTDLINAANSTNAPRSFGSSAPRSSSIPPTSHPSSESALLYMEMLKNGYGPLFRDSSVPNPTDDPVKQQQQLSAAELLMQQRLLSLDRPDDMSRVHANVENLTNRILEHEKEKSLIASTMATLIENNNSSSDTKSVMDRMSNHLHHSRDVDRPRGKNGFPHDDRGYERKSDPYLKREPYEGDPYGMKPDRYGSNSEPYRMNNEPYGMKGDSHARSSPRRPVQPRRFLSLGDIRDDHSLPHPGRDMSHEMSRSQNDQSHLPLDRSYVKQEEIHRSDDIHRRPDKSQQRQDEAPSSTAEASRSTAELLIQLNQGKLSSRTPSEKSANGWTHDRDSFDRNDSSRHKSSHSRASSPSQTTRRPVQPRSFLSSNYVQDVGGESKTGSLNPQQPNHNYDSDLMAGGKRSINDMMKSQDEDGKENKHKSAENDDKSDNPALKRFKPYHEDKWMENFQQLLKYKEEHGNCLVPHTYLRNPLLARWVKRQRRQYKLYLEKCPQSTMTPERIEILNKEGFVWDSHEITWMKKFYDLIDYKKIHGHCRVPSCSKEHPQLATWVKCQRRQYRLKREGKSSAMTAQRIKLLDDVGFSWEVRFAAPTTA